MYLDCVAPNECKHLKLTGEKKEEEEVFIFFFFFLVVVVLVDCYYIRH